MSTEYSLWESCVHSHELWRCVGEWLSWEAAMLILQRWRATITCNQLSPDLWRVENWPMWVQRLGPLVVCVASSYYTGLGKNPGSDYWSEDRPGVVALLLFRGKRWWRSKRTGSHESTLGSRPSLATKWRFCAWPLVRQSVGPGSTSRRGSRWTGLRNAQNNLPRTDLKNLKPAWFRSVAHWRLKRVWCRLRLKLGNPEGEKWETGFRRCLVDVNRDAANGIALARAQNLADWNSDNLLKWLGFWLLGKE